MKITSFDTHVMADGYLAKMKCIYQMVQHHIPEDTCLYNHTAWKKHLYMTKPALRSIGTTESSISYRYASHNDRDTFENCVVRRFCSCVNVIECTYTNLDSIAYYTPRLYGIAYCS